MNTSSRITKNPATRTGAALLRRKQSHPQAGLTIIELLIVIGIILVLTGIAVPSIFRGRLQAQIGALSDEFRLNYEAFALFAQEKGQFPPTCSPPNLSSMPTGMDLYMPKRSTWLVDNSNGSLTSPQFRGRWFWINAKDNPVADLPGYSGFIMFGSPDLTQEAAKKIDEALDDGDLTTGAIRYEDGFAGFKWIYFGIQ